MAELAKDDSGISMPRITETFKDEFEKAQLGDKVRGLRFWLALEQLSSLESIRTSSGADIRDFLTTPGITYIAGSRTDPRAIQAQKIVLFRLMQLIDKRHGDCHKTLMLDELKYILSSQVLTLLSTVRDRGCNLMLAHQSLGDLADCGALDQRAVYGAVVTNTALKLCFRCPDKDTAKWFSEASGSINAMVGNFHIPGSVWARPSSSSGSWREAQRNYIEENTLLHLAHRGAVVYGSGLPVQVTVPTIPEGPYPKPTFSFPVEPTPVEQIAKEMGKRKGKSQSDKQQPKSRPVIVETIPSDNQEEL